MKDGTCLSAENLIGLKIAVSDAFDLKSIFMSIKESLMYRKKSGPRAMSINPGMSLNSACQ